MSAKKILNRYGVKKGKKSFPMPLKILLILLVLGGVSFGGAWAWQTMQEEQEPGFTGDLNPARTEELLSQPEPEQPSEPEPAPAASESEPEPEEADEPEEGDGEEASSGGYAVRPQYASAVPEGKRVDNSYFDDAIFFGDSISVGIPLYNVMPNADVVAVQGIHPVNATTKEAVETADGDMTMLQAAAQYGEKGKVYIMLGGNGLWFEKEPFIQGYREFIGEVKAQYPGAIIYLQSMTPVTDFATEKYPSAVNEVIDEYNLAIMALAKEQGLYYLDVAASMVDEEGKLPTEASPLDGMHLTAEYYAKWFEYLRTHTVAAPPQ